MRRTKVLAAAHQGYRHGEARGPSQSGDLAAGLDRGSDLARMLAEPSDCLLEVLTQQSQSPEARRAAGAIGARREHLLRLLDQLEDDLAEPEEGLARRARGRRLLADSAQVQAGRLECVHTAVERG